MCIQIKHIITQKKILFLLDNRTKNQWKENGCNKKKKQF